MKYIPLHPLSRGLQAIVDDEDFESLSAFHWSINSGPIPYDIRYFRENGKQHGVLMHRQILNVSRNLHTDHANGNGLDNRKINLRACDRSQNMCNRKMHSNNSTGIKGVRFHKKSQRWDARIQVRGVSHSLGYYSSPAEAKEAYDKASLEFHGEFARTNAMM